jgi:hypothetical protein
MKSIDAAKAGWLKKESWSKKSLLSDEILKDNFYRDGLHEYQPKNPEILAAVAILNNAQQQYWSNGR